MSDTKRLDENTIRRFMKLAKIEGLADNFVEQSPVLKEGKEAKKVKGGKEVEEGYGSKHHKKPKAEEMAEAYGEKPEEMEEGLEGSGGGEGDSVDMSEEELGDMEMEEGSSKAVVTRVLKAISEEFPELGMEVEESGEEGDELAMAEPQGDEEEEEEEEEEEGEEEEGEEEEMAEAYDGQEQQDENLTEAILARVKARLLAEARAKKGAMSAKEKMKAKKAAAAKKSGKPTDEAKKAGKSGGKVKGHGAGSKEFGVGKGVGNVAKSSAKKGNMTPAKSSTKHTK